MQNYYGFFNNILQRDIAIEKWGRMREKTLQHFKFTPWTSFLAILWAGVVPLAFYSLLKWDLHRKDKNEGFKPRKFL